jgi:hypothetical protein
LANGFGTSQAQGATAHARAILWVQPDNIRSRNLYFGRGGKEHQPQVPLQFLGEDSGGSNPKFDVRDASGAKWKAKLGLEAKPETAATRLLWAVGFISNENYLLPEVKVREMPHALRRGQDLVGPEGEIQSVRLQRSPGGKKIGIWSWKHNPFKGTREFNGLRVMMALLNNWDLKDENNAMFPDPEAAEAVLYEVSDVGASFGRAGESYTHRMSKNNLAAYRRSKFVSKVTPRDVSFNFPTHLPFLYALNFPLFISHLNRRWIGRHVPREDVKWIGSLLAQLSPEQIRDAFRAAGYSSDEIEAYTTAVQSRIDELKKL